MGRHDPSTQTEGEEGTAADPSWGSDKRTIPLYISTQHALEILTFHVCLPSGARPTRHPERTRPNLGQSFKSIFFFFFFMKDEQNRPKSGQADE